MGNFLLVSREPLLRITVQLVGWPRVDQYESADPSHRLLGKNPEIRTCIQDTLMIDYRNSWHTYVHALYA